MHAFTPEGIIPRQVLEDDWKSRLCFNLLYRSHEELVEQRIPGLMCVDDIVL